MSKPTKSDKRNAIVIGAGFGGLSAALHLAKKGYSVEIIEKNSKLGGRAQVWESKGYRFDMGPSWYLLPEIYEKIFADLDEKIPFDLIKLPEAYKVYYDDDTTITVPNNPDETIKLFESVEDGAGKKLELYLKNAKRAHELGFGKIVEKSPSILRYFHPQIVLNAFILKPWKSLHAHVQSYVKNPRLQQLLEYEAVFLGGTPYSIPALYSLVSYWDIVRGVYYPKGGFSVLVTLFEDLCVKYGVKITLSKSVTDIIVENKRAVGVKLDDGDIKKGDIVIVNADYQHAEEKLLPDKYTTYKEKFWEKADITPSGLIIYLGVKKRLSGLKHHNFYFSKHWKQNATDIANRKWSADPSYYICVPSLTDDVAPDGCENIFILVPLANGVDDSNKEKEADKILAHMEKTCGVSFIDDIEVKRVFCVSDFTSEYNAYKGNAFGLGHTLKHSLIRPEQKSRKVKNLYFVGQYTHPGTGVPMAVLSGKQISELIEKYE